MWICKDFCIVFNQNDHIFDSYMKYSDRLRILLTHRPSSNFNSVLELLKKLVVTSNTSPILIFLRIHPFGWEALSSRGRVYSRQATVCWNSQASLVTKYCPTSTTRINPASLQNLLNLFSFNLLKILLQKGLIFCGFFIMSRYFRLWFRQEQMTVQPK